MNVRSKFHVEHFAVLFFLSLGVTCQAQAPAPGGAPTVFAKPTAEQKLAIRDAQVQVRDISAQMNQIADFFKGLQNSLAAAQAAEKTAREKAKEANGCRDCDFTDTLDLVKPVKAELGSVAKPEPAKAVEPEKKP